MTNSKSGTPYIRLMAFVLLVSAAWSSSTMAEFPQVGAAVNSAMQKFDTQSGIASRPGVSPNRTSAGSSTGRSISMPSGRGGSGLSISSHETRSNSGGRNSRNNYSNNYSNNVRYNSGRSYNSRNNYGGRRSSSGAYFTGGLILGAWLGGNNRYDPYYYGGYSNRYSGSYNNSHYYNNRDYSNGYYNNSFSNRNYQHYSGSNYRYDYPSNSTKYYRTAPVEPKIIYREKIVSDAAARIDKEPHMLRDLEGNCFEISYSTSGQELRLQVPVEQCVWKIVAD
jgi:hypothetical protein